MKKTKWLALCLGMIWTCSAFAQPRADSEETLVITANMQFDYAEKLYENKDYSAARMAYDRLIHFFPEDGRIQESRYKSGVCLFARGEYQKAARIFEQLIRKGRLEQGWTLESYFMQSHCFQAMENPGYAKLVLLNLLRMTRNPDTRDRAQLELARLTLKNSKTLGPNTLEQAHAHLKELSDTPFRKQNQGKIDALVEAQRLPRKNPALAGIFSIIPGGGYLYCGRYKDALVTFGFNTGLILAARRAFRDDNPALGGVISFIETGFYAGNIYGGISSAHKANRKQTVEILNREFDFKSEPEISSRSWLFSFRHSF